MKTETVYGKNCVRFTNDVSINKIDVIIKAESVISAKLLRSPALKDTKLCSLQKL